MPKRISDFTQSTKEHLEMRVGSMCSRPACGQLTRGPKLGDAEGHMSIGEAAHITAASEGGPRYDPNLTHEQRISFDNGIWLCKAHHRIVDCDSSPFNATTLREWKIAAEGVARKAMEYGEARASEPSLVSVLHKSMEGIPNDSLRRSLPSVFESAGNREVVVDACDLYLSGALSDPREAMQRQVQRYNELKAVLNDHPGVDVAYYGIAHVPLAFHFGYLVSTKLAPHFAERDRTTEVWKWLKTDSSSELELKLQRPDGDWSSATDAVIRVGVSYPVLAEQTDPVIFSVANFEIGFTEPVLDKVKSRADVEKIAEYFRGLLDEITMVSSIQRVHVFASVPMCVAFALGQQISSSIHPKVFVYNYRRQDDPSYKWGILMTGDIAANDAVVLDTKNHYV